jgi:hypothetical protein
MGSSPNIPLNASVSDQIAMQFDLDKFILRLCKIGCVWSTNCGSFGGTLQN